MAAKRVGAGNFAENPERAAEAGARGRGRTERWSVNRRVFHNSPERASEAGLKGGLVRKKGVQTQLLPDVG